MALVAGASILVDYVLTVAVSVTAGVAAITSAFPEVARYRVPLCLAFVALMTVANLRGLKESGTIFAAPTYIYVTILFAMIVVGLYRYYSGDIAAIPPNETAIHELTGGAALTGISVMVLLRAFASGAVALTGVEAIADGVPAFQKPESKNAARTLSVDGDHPRHGLLRPGPAVQPPPPDGLRGRDPALDPRRARSSARGPSSTTSCSSRRSPS